MAYTPDNIDGVDLMQMLTPKKELSGRKLYWHYPHYSNQGGKPSSAIRDGNYKLIYYYEDDQLELYDLQQDSGEKNNIISTKKALAEKMKLDLFRWLHATNSSFPKKNPGYSILAGEK